MKQTPEEEKKLVAEKLMGWSYVPEREGTRKTRGEVARFDKEKPKKGYYEWTWVQDWNPQKNDAKREWWDEIWEKMDNKLFSSYMAYLDTELGCHIVSNPIKIHTAKPEICWKALVKSLI